MRIWLGFLEASARISAKLGESIKAISGLTFDDYEVLVHLSESEGRRLRMTELSQRLLHSQSRLTQRVDRLGTRGLVSREKGPDDRRGTFACITNEGAALIKEIAPQHVCDVRSLLIDLVEPDEREVIAQVFERLAAAARDSQVE